MSRVVLAYSNVTVEYSTGVRASRDVSFSLREGECLALVGESGCGKTTLARAALGLLPPGTRVSGSIQVDGIEIVGASDRTLRRLRGLVIGFVAQDPFEACNPLDRVMIHVAEAWRAHRLRPPSGVIARILAALNIRDAPMMMRRYPHQWSGGMLQRATIAAAGAHHPPLIIADEPTSALDSDLADSTLADLRRTGATLLLVSHNLGQVARHADRVAVLYAGQIVEIATAEAVLNHPCHPYTIALLEALPRPGAGLPEALPGAPPNLSHVEAGCSFAPRCRHARDTCYTQTPVLHGGVACPVIAPRGREQDLPSLGKGSGQDVIPEPEPPASRSSRPAHGAWAVPSLSKRFVVEARRVSKIYDKGVGSVHALVSASLQVERGEIVGICGPSGCGKSTFLRLLSTIELPTTGQVYLGGELATVGGNRRISSRLARSGYVMPIFQDPMGSLDRNWAIWRTITEPLMAPHCKEHLSPSARREIARAKLHDVGLAQVSIEARPDELSVGQCQRVAIARALLAQPALLIADEPTSALDVSVSASILRLLAAVAERGTAIVVVSHDRLVLGALCHRILTMTAGVLEDAL